MKMGIDRRRFLVGSSGAILALPWLPSLWGNTAQAQSLVAPKRLVVFFHSQGLVRTRWKPPSVGALPATGDISPILAPLGPIRDRVTVLSGLGNPMRFALAGDNHRRANTTTLTYETPQSDNLAGGASIDQAAAELLRGNAPRSSILLPASADPVGETFFFSKTGNTVTPQTPFSGNPRAAAQALFAEVPDGSAPITQPTLQQRLTRQRGTIVDAVAKNLTTLRNQVSSEDRARLDSHAEHLHALSRRFTAGAPVSSISCTRPDYAQIPSYDSAPYGSHDNETAPAQVDNLVRAFACDITRVGSIYFNVHQDPRFPWLYGGDMAAATAGFSDWHGMVHTGQDTGNDSDPGLPRLVAGMKTYAEQFTRLVQGLAATPDVGGTTLLDNTLVLWMSDFGDHNHGVNDIPVIMAGLTGKLPAGQHVKMSGGYTTGDLFTTVLRLLGAPDTTTFGRTGMLTSAFDTWAWNDGNFTTPYPLQRGLLPI